VFRPAAATATVVSSRDPSRVSVCQPYHSLDWAALLGAAAATTEGADGQRMTALPSAALLSLHPIGSVTSGSDCGAVGAGGMAFGSCAGEATVGPFDPAGATVLLAACSSAREVVLTATVHTQTPAPSTIVLKERHARSLDHVERDEHKLCRQKRDGTDAAISRSLARARCGCRAIDGSVRRTHCDARFNSFRPARTTR
jgi:hypothetical protein